MTMKKLPELQAKHSKKLSFDPREDALARWQPEIKSSQTDTDTLELYGIVGDEWSDTPVTAAAVSQFLRGKNEITVSVNSPGGSYFEGIAIYNLLRAHPHKITVKVLGDAASAASVIAMAGDEILMGEGAFMMIHNCWGVCIGNRSDLADSMTLMEQIDDAMANLYTAQTGKDKAEIIAMMDAETWLNADNAVAQGFATALLREPPPKDADAHTAKHLKAEAQIQNALRAQGMGNMEMRQILQNYQSADMQHSGNRSPNTANQPAYLQAILNGLKTLTTQET